MRCRVNEHHLCGRYPTCIAGLRHVSASLRCRSMQQCWRRTASCRVSAKRTNVMPLPNAATAEQTYNHAVTQHTRVCAARSDLPLCPSCHLTQHSRAAKHPDSPTAKHPYSHTCKQPCSHAAECLHLSQGRCRRRSGRWPSRQTRPAARLSAYGCSARGAVTPQTHRFQSIVQHPPVKWNKSDLKF